MIGSSIGNYVIQRQIGEGGMGSVYLAEHPRIGRKVAIKVLLRELSANAQAVSRFFNEARASSEIHNDHIVDILDFGELPDGASYLVMEFLDGPTLARALRDGPLGIARTMHVVNGIGRALEAAHAAGIVHRDLKPDNVILVQREGDSDFAKVLDFGIAKLMQTQVDSDVKTKTGSLIGTPAYMSPEQCRGNAVDHRSDIYSLGVMTYQMLCGRLPFEADGLGNLLLAHMTQMPTPIAQLVPELPPHLADVVARAMEKLPEQRFQRIEEMLAAIGDASGRYSTLAGDGRAPGRSWELPATKSRFDTVGGSVAAEAVRRTQPARKSSWLPMLLVVGAGTIAGGAWLVRARRVEPLQRQNAAAPRSTLPPPGAASTELPAPNANVPSPNANVPAANVPAPGEVHLRVRVQPAAARLFLDGAPIANPFDGSFTRSTARHKLEAHAPGHRSEVEWIAFDGDRSVDLALGKQAPRTIATTPAQPPSDGRPIYKGTKGKLITDYPGE